MPKSDLDYLSPFSRKKIQTDSRVRKNGPKILTLVCNGDKNLVPCDENPSGGGSVFIYSPYESDKPKNEIKWCRGESNSVLITFRNPLR